MSRPTVRRRDRRTRASLRVICGQVGVSTCGRVETLPRGSSRLPPRRCYPPDGPHRSRAAEGDCRGRSRLARSRRDGGGHGRRHRRGPHPASTDERRGPPMARGPAPGLARRLPAGLGGIGLVACRLRSAQRKLWRLHALRRCVSRPPLRYCRARRSSGCISARNLAIAAAVGAVPRLRVFPRFSDARIWANCARFFAAI